TERSAEWVPLRPTLVVEVSYDHFSEGRFRHGTSFQRWRPDKAPEQCTFDQLARGDRSPLELLDAWTGRGHRRVARACADFAVKGDVGARAVGISIGAAFGTFALSLVDGVIMPPIGLILGGVGFSVL